MQFILDGYGELQCVLSLVAVMHSTIMAWHTVRRAEFTCSVVITWHLLALNLCGSDDLLCIGAVK
jgi:hypothetical protein